MAFNAAPTNWNGNTCTNFTLGDFNGDGRTDRLCRIEGVMNVSLATAEGFTGPISQPASWVYAAVGAVPHIADVNQDGKQDLVFYDNFDGKFYVAKSLGNRFEDVVLWGTASGQWGGQGYTCRLDTLRGGNGRFQRRWPGGRLLQAHHERADLRGPAQRLAHQPGLHLQHLRQLHLRHEHRAGGGDRPGCGRQDRLLLHGGLEREVLRPALERERLPDRDLHHLRAFCNLPDWQLGDLNGDGLPDATCAANGNLGFGTGNAFRDYGNFAGTACTPSKAFPADVDGDGTAEIVCNSNGAGATDIQVRKWDGTALTPWSTWKANWCPDKVYPGDFNGGREDRLAL